MAFLASEQGSSKVLTPAGVYQFVVEDIKLKQSLHKEGSSYFNIRLRIEKDDGNRGVSVYTRIGWENPNKQYLERQYGLMGDFLFAAGIEGFEDPDDLIQKITGKSLMAKVFHNKEGGEDVSDFMNLDKKKRIPKK